MAEQLLQLPTTEQREVYRAAAAELGLPEAIVEKDVWICWVLDALFSAPGKLPMAFKGGTSLSKAYQAIHRFSEDVDLTIGFDELSLPLPESRKQRDNLKDELSRRVAEHVSEHVVPLLIDRFADEFGLARRRSNWMARKRWSSTTPAASPRAVGTSSSASASSSVGATASSRTTLSS